jgi:hypothetical protein
MLTVVFNLNVHAALSVAAVQTPTATVSTGVRAKMFILGKSFPTHRLQLRRKDFVSRKYILSPK